MENKKLSKKEFAQQMEEKRKKLNARADNQINITINNKFDYLKFLSLFKHGYTVTNTLLIQHHNPNVILLKDYPRWKEEGTPVKKEEKGIEIFVPGKPYIGRDGKEKVTYNIKSIFDITQTTTETISESSYPNMKQLEEVLKYKQIDAAPQPLDMEDNDYLVYLIQKLCEKEASSQDSFIINSAVYALSERYGLISNDEFASECIHYFQNLDSKVIRGKLQSIKNIYDSVSKQIEHRLFIWKQEHQHAK